MIRPLTNRRDELPDKRRIHELVMIYKLHVPTKGKVRIRPAALQHDEVFGAFESRLYQLFDANKRLVAGFEAPRQLPRRARFRGAWRRGREARRPKAGRSSS